MTDDKYGQAIRVLHHGCEEAIEVAGGTESERFRLFALGASFGYALALEVMTRRPAVEHVERALRVVGERHGGQTPEDEPVLLPSLYLLSETLGVPHEAWEKKRAAEAVERRNARRGHYETAEGSEGETE